MKKIKKILLFLLFLSVSFILTNSSQLKVNADINTSVNVDVLGNVDKVTIKNSVKYTHTTKIQKVEYNLKNDQELEILKGFERDHFKQNCVNDFTAYMNALNSAVNLTNSIRLTEGGDFDTAACVDGVLNTAAAIAACCGPYGMIVSVGISAINGLFKVAMGGQDPDSEVTQMQFQVNSKLNEMSAKIDEVDNHILELSNKIDSLSSDIIEGVTTELDNKEAKMKVDEFMKLSSKDDFSYNFFKNYIIGSNDASNIYRSSAYYASLQESILNNDSEEVIKTKYDRLYSSIMNNMDIYLNEIIVENDKSIVQYYYDVLSANPNLCPNSSPELEALRFSDDLYNTFIKAYHIIAQCNLYYSVYMAKYNMEKCYIEGYGTLLLNDIYNYKNQKRLIDDLQYKVDALDKQTAKDIIYILNLNGFYLVKEENGYIHEVSENHEAFGKLVKGQTVYFNSITDYVSKYFNLDKNDFKFSFGCKKYTQDSITVGDEDYINVCLYYKDTLLYELDFKVYDDYTFDIGTGSEEDPYLIYTEDQFLKIQNNLDKHFELINNIDLSSCGSISPFGIKVLNDQYAFDEFTGTLNGNGYSIKNLTISGKYDKVGLFGTIGSKGIVSNINFINPQVSSSQEIINNPDAARDSNSDFFGGIVAGLNNGIIKYCSISSDGTKNLVSPKSYYIYDNLWDTLFNPSDNLNINKYGIEYKLDNSQHNINLYVKVGGIVGQNNNTISCCKIEEVKVIGASQTNMGGERGTQKNQNNVYVGGIVGYNYGTINYSYVSKTTQVGSSARTILNPSTNVTPILLSFAGGITAANYDKKYSLIKEVYSEANIIFDSVQAKCESGYGSGLLKKAENGKDCYIPKISSADKKNIISAIELKEKIIISPNSSNIQYEFVDKNNDGVLNGTEYGNHNPTFDCSELVFKYNNEEINYDYITCYNFNTLVDNKDGEKVTVTIIFSAKINNVDTIFAKEVDIQVKNSIINVEITNLNNIYELNEFKLEGLRLKLYYQVGNPSIIELTSKLISEKNIVLNKKYNQIGINELYFVYEGFTIEFEINVYCDHGYDFYNEANENFVLKNDLSKKATCTEVGYNVYECKHCQSQKIYYLGLAEHEYVVDGYVEATCNSIGHTGKVYCSVCNYIYSEDQTIPLINHEYSCLDENQHQCLLKYNDVECGHLEAHNFVVQDSVQLLNIDGESKYYIVLNKECYDCGYQEEERLYDETLIENQLNTKIVISDGYVLPTQNEVVVYVHLVNNKYVINGANFGIRYSDGLKLLEIEDGNIFSSSWELKNGTPTNNGYNFFCASGQQKFSNDGVLLKLRFRIIDEVVVGKKYDVSLVYTNGIDKDGKIVSGGFSIEDGKKQLFTTYSGTITVVDHLPGDVNSDGSVDIMDAILISLYVINPSENHIDKVNGNVNLCIPNEGESEVDPDDAIAILKYIIGSFTDNPVHQVKDNKVNIKLNYNISYAESSLNNLTSITDDYYVLNDNEQYVPNTYLNVGLDELSINREGYKFLGWFTSPYGGTKVEFYNDSTNKIGPLPIDSSIETLYAQWELNTLTILSNDSTHKYNNSDEYILGDNQIKTLDKDTIDDIDDGYEKKYEVDFHSEIDDFHNMIHYLQYETCIWNLYSKKELIKQFNSLYEAICYLRENQYYGNVTLLPNYSNPNIDLDKIGELWTNSRFDSPIWRNINGDKITSEDIIESFERLGSTDSYYVKAEHHEKEYKVYFDFNGGVDMNGTFPYDVDNRGNKTNYIVVTYSNANVFDSSDKVEIIKNNYYFNKWTFTSTDNQTVSFDKIDKVYLDEVIKIYGSQSQEINLKLNWAGENVKVTFKDQSDSSDKVVYEVNYAYGDEFINENTKQYFSDSDIKYWYFIENNEMKIIEEGTIVEDASDFDIYAVFNEYTITLDLNISNVDDNSSCYSTYSSVEGLKNNSQFNLKYGENFTLVAPTSEYYTFIGWYYGDKQITDSTGKSLSEFSFLKDTYTLTARWNKVKNGYTYIKTVEDLKNINKNTSGKYFLIQNICPNNGPGNYWIPLNTFSGVLDGNYKTICHLNINLDGSAINDTKYYGLFKVLNGTVEKLNFVNCNITVSSKHDGNGWIYAGIISGHGNGIIKNCKVTGGSTVTVHRDKSEIGMITGCFNGTIDNCNVNDCQIYGNGDIGGITGGLVGKVIYCQVTNSKITQYAVNNRRSSGGIVGYNNNGTIQESQVHYMTFRLEGEYTLRPNQGIIVGKQDNGSIIKVGASIANPNTITKELAKDFNINWTVKEKILGITVKTNHYSNDNYFGEGWGYAGECEGKVTIQ